MTPQFLALFLHIVAIVNCFKLLKHEPDHKVKAEIAMILSSSVLFCGICVCALVSYAKGNYNPQGDLVGLWQVFSVYNALTYAISTKRLNECSISTMNSCKKLKP